MSHAVTRKRKVRRGLKSAGQENGFLPGTYVVPRKQTRFVPAIRLCVKIL